MQGGDKGKMMTLRSLCFVLAGPLLVCGAPVMAQDAAEETDVAPAPVNDGTLRINQVTVYGDDPCPQSTGDDIVVCGRLAEDERYRIPEALRGNPNDPRRESWTSRVQSLERVGMSGTDSCSTAGLGGFTGCQSQLINNAYAERRQSAGSDWTDAVAAARRERMEGYDAEARAVEEQVARDEAERVAREQAAAESTEASETDPDPSPLPSPLAATPQ